MFDFIKDIFSAFKQTSLERVKSPFLGAFAFSWVAFNWQPLIILLFSEKPVEKRLGLINDHYDIGSFLLGPLCTTILITFTLPQINKIITKVQDKPNSDTIELTLSSKIRVAELQQSIAELEAKKKLANKKEEKYIEESIYRIKDENIKLNEQVLNGELEITDLNKKINDTIIESNNYKSLLNAEKESREKAEKNAAKISDSNISLNSQIRDLEVKVANSESVVTSLLKERDSYLKQIEDLKEKFTLQRNQIIQLNFQYPSVIQTHNVDDVIELTISDDAYQEIYELNQKIAYSNLTNKLKSTPPNTIR